MLVFGDDESIAIRDFRALSFNLGTKKATSTTDYDYLGRGRGRGRGHKLLNKGI